MAVGVSATIIRICMIHGSSNLVPNWRRQQARALTLRVAAEVSGASCDVLKRTPVNTSRALCASTLAGLFDAREARAPYTCRIEQRTASPHETVSHQRLDACSHYDALLGGGKYPANDSERFPPHSHCTACWLSCGA
jgi:hypothetical protein